MKLYHIILILSVAQAAHAKVVVNKEICDQIMIDATPEADVAYKPDEDPNVPPADIGGSIKIKPPTQINIPVYIDLQKYTGGGVIPPSSNQNSGDVGNIVVHSDGRIYFNGQPLFHEDEYMIKQACRELQGQH